MYDFPIADMRGTKTRLLEEAAGESLGARDDRDTQSCGAARRQVFFYDVVIICFDVFTHAYVTHALNLNFEMRVGGRAF